MSSSNQHTPGPWRIGKAVNGNWIEAAHAAQPVSIARTFYEGVGAATEDANARLIAAAPELLEALEGLLANLTEGDFISETRIDAARAAIAKATANEGAA